MKAVGAATRRMGEGAYGEEKRAMGEPLWTAGRVRRRWIGAR